jgi:O-antigen/teichoic acid export membrane protein
MFGFIAISSTYVFGTLLTANGSLKTLNIVAASGMVLNLLINLMLVPRLLAVGSAYASLFAQYTTAVIQLIVAARLFKFKVDYRYLLTLAIFLAGLVFLNVFSKQIFENWMYNFMVMVFAAILLAMVLKLLNIKGLIEILKTKENTLEGSS